MPRVSYCFVVLLGLWSRNLKVYMVLKEMEPENRVDNWVLDLLQTSPRLFFFVCV